MVTPTLTFSDWDNYVDDNATAFTLDWSSASAMQGKFAYPYVDALRLALNERMAVFGLVIPALPQSSLFTRHWAWHVIESVAGLVVGSSYGGGYWIDPALLTTLHNVQHRSVGNALSTAITDAAYTGLNIGLPGVSNPAWTASLNHLMDDSGVTDATFRAWAEAWNTRANTTYAPCAMLLFNLKLMLSKLDTLVILDVPRPADTAVSQPWGSEGLMVIGGTSEGRSVHYEDSTLWATASREFNATEWSSTWSEEGPYWSSVGYKGQDGYHNLTINRVRRLDYFGFPNMPRVTIEIAGNLYNGEGGGFAPVDFAGLSGYDYEGTNYLLAVQDAVTGISPAADIGFGDYDNCPTSGELIDWQGWLLGNYSFRFDFATAGQLVFHA